MASYVGGHDWPRGDPDTDLTPAEIMAVLDGLDEYWEPAIHSLEEKR